MALKFAKKAAMPLNTEAAEKPSADSSKKTLSTVSFLKKGKAAKELLAYEEAQAELRRQEAGRMWRFWMPDGEDRQITFLDGALDDDGMLDIYMFYEHSLRLNGKVENFVCTAAVDETQPCPICESGDRASFVGVMTVIDHSEQKIKSGPNAGKVISNTRKLFVAKQSTIKQLTKIAAKRGGLTGCTFDVSRTGHQSPSVGNQFDFVQKFDSYEEIAEACGLKVEDVQPANYEEEIRYLSPEQLIELGVGKALVGPGLYKGSNLKEEL